MAAKEVYGVLTQLGTLLRAEARVETGLQPVQVQVLNYLSICNRYSDTPAAVADYLGLTKGTVSQTVRVLAESGWVEKVPDSEDGRVVHLRLTREGKRLVERAVPPPVLLDALEGMSAAQQERALATLRELLCGLQRSNDGLSFGVCHTCKHFVREDEEQFRCGLTGEALTPPESLLNCREHLA